jgi:hypothetical protein
MNLEIIEENKEYITIRIPTKSKKQRFIETEEEIAQKVNEVRNLTKVIIPKKQNNSSIIKS